VGKAARRSKLSEPPPSDCIKGLPKLPRNIQPWVTMPAGSEEFQSLLEQ